MVRERTSAERVEQDLQNLAVKWYEWNLLPIGKRKSELFDLLNAEYQKLESDNQRSRVDQKFRELQESAERNIKKP